MISDGRYKLEVRGVVMQLARLFHQKVNKPKAFTLADARQVAELCVAEAMAVIDSYANMTRKEINERRQDNQDHIVELLMKCPQTDGN